MGYVNQVLGGRDGRGRETARDAGAAGIILADLTPDEGAAFESVARDAGLAVVYLVAPTTPPERRAMIATRSGGFLYCVSLVGVTGARTSLSADVARLVRDVRAASPVPVGVGFGVEQAGTRARAREGRCRWGHRRLRARRRARAGRPGHSGARAPGPQSPGAGATLGA